MADTSNYERLGHLVPERFESEGGVGQMTAELYECLRCHAVVWWGSITGHNDWHDPHAPDARRSTVAMKHIEAAAPGVHCRNCNQRIVLWTVIDRWRHVDTDSDRCSITYAEPPQSDEGAERG